VDLGLDDFEKVEFEERATALCTFRALAWCKYEQENPNGLVFQMSFLG
jgi:hypothetical protein